MPFSVAYLLLVGCAAILNIGLAAFAWTYRKAPGAVYVTITCLSVAEVVAMFMVMTMADSPDVGYMAARFRFMGLALIAPSVLFFSFVHAQQAHLLTRRNILLLLAIPVLTQIVLWSPAHTAFFASWALNMRWEWNGEVSTFGFWFYIHTAYSTALFIVGIVLMSRYALRVDSSRRRFVLMVVTGTVFGLPLVTFPFTIGPEPGLLVAPLVLSAITGVVAGSFLRTVVVNVMPVAYDLVFASISESVLVTDADNIVINANPAAVRLFERPLNELIRQPVSTVMAKVTDWPASDPPPELFQVNMMSCGKSLVCSVTRLPMIRGGKTMGYLIAMRDITAEQRAFDLSLEQERSRLLGSFIADASHEFRTPLSIIKSSVFLLGKVTEGDKARDYLARIDTQSDRIDRLVDDLQTMSALDTPQTLVRDHVNLNFIITGLLDEFVRRRAAEKNIALDAKLDPSLPHFTGSPDNIALALEKVLDNALRYTPEGGEIHISAAQVDDKIRVTVADTGAGMDEETARQALTRFFRSDSAHTTAGFGLGLPIAHRIVEKHEGTLSLESSAGSGTTVIITLPLDPPR